MPRVTVINLLVSPMTFQVQEKIIDYTTTACQPSDPKLAAEYKTCAEFVEDSNNTAQGRECDCEVLFTLNESFSVSIIDERLGMVC